MMLMKNYSQAKANNHTLVLSLGDSIFIEQINNQVFKHH